jgi:hypothetical protein
MVDEFRARKDEFRAALKDWLATKSFDGPEKVVMALGYVGAKKIPSAISSPN